MNFNNILQQQLESFVDKEILQNSEVQKLLESVNETYNKYESELGQFTKLKKIADENNDKPNLQNKLNALPSSILNASSNVEEPELKPSFSDWTANPDDLDN